MARQNKPYVDLERRTLHIPVGAINTENISDIVAGKHDLPPGKYGQSKYGRCRYGVRYGIYGFDKYGQCQYR